MIVWVLIIMINGGQSGRTSTALTVIDNIASAESCEQLAKVVRSSPRPETGGIAATCAPVRKVKP